MVLEGSYSGHIFFDLHFRSEPGVPDDLDAVVVGVEGLGHLIPDVRIKAPGNGRVQDTAIGFSRLTGSHFLELGKPRT